MSKIIAYTGNISLWNETTTPDGVVSAGLGSIATRSDAAGLHLNSDGGTTWVPVMLGSGTTAFTAAVVWTLLDNTAAALTIGTTGAASMLVFVTTNGAEAINAGVRLTTTDGVAAGTARVIGGRAGVSVADSTTIVGNGAAQTFDVSYSIPASTLKSGSTVRVWVGVRRIAINGADTAVVAVRVGGTTYVSSPAVAAAAGDRCYAQLCLTARAAPGAAVTVVGIGCAGWSTAAAIQLAGGGSAALATNGALAVDVQITMAANAGNTAALETFVVDVV